MTRKSTILGAAIFVLFGSTSLPTLAQDTSSTCTNAGRTYTLGQTVCIAACHGARRLARCDVVVETASWVYISEVCPSAMFVPPPPAGLSQTPLIAAMTPLPGPLKMSPIAPAISVQLANLQIGSLPIR
jgi:hypothetical protein